MNDNEYTCERCRRTFLKALPDEQAIREANRGIRHGPTHRADAIGLRMTVTRRWICRLSLQRRSNEQTQTIQSETAAPSAATVGEHAGVLAVSKGHVRSL